MNHLTSLLSALFLAAFLLPAPHASAQTVEDLRRENQQLRDRIQELERQIRELGKTPRQPQAPASPATAPADTQPDTSEPLHLTHPAAVIDAIRARWQADAADVPMGEENTRERVAYARFVEKWVAATNREYRKRVNWTVRLVSADRIEGNYALRLVVVDPETGRDLGESFPVRITRAQANRLETWNRRGGGHLELHGVLLPQLRFNAERLNAGVFDSPTFIAPLVEFPFDMQVESIAPVKAANPRQGEDAPPSSRPGTR